MKKLKIRIAQERLALALNFIECGEIDIRAAKILYDEGIYSLAIYHLQQAVEKAAKADYYCLTYWEEELDNIKGHESTLNLIITMRAVMETGTRIGLDKEMPPTNIQDFIEIVDIKKSLVTSSLCAEQILDMLAESDRDVYEKGVLTDGIILKELSLAQSPSKITESLKGMQEARENTEILSNLLMGALLTDAHVITTRYPDVKNKTGLSPLDYSLRMGLVMVFPQLFDRISRTIGLIRKQQSYLAHHPNLQ